MPVVALVVVLVLLWAALGVIGLLVHGLTWLTIAAVALLVVTLVLGGALLRRRRPVR